MKRSKVERRLSSFQRDRRYVRIWRRGLDDFALNGYVVALGRRWVLLARVDDSIRRDGWTAVRLRDVTRVERGRSGRFVGRALKARGQWPPRRPTPAVNLNRRTALLSTAAAGRTMITVHPELSRTDVCYIGQVKRVSRRFVHLRGITPKARWDDEPTRHRLRDITRVDFGTAYEEALLLVGGKPT